MNPNKIILGGLIATSLMTLFSYTVSYIKSSRFKEPELLNILISRSTFFSFNPSKKNVTGWMIHYFIGWIFVTIFDLIWNFTFIEPSLVSGSFLGFLAGFVGITGWKLMFRSNTDPPGVEFKNFYFHLMIAHIIFGAGASIVYL